MTALAARPSTRAPLAGKAAAADRLPWPLALFIASMVVPAAFTVELAGLSLSPQRIVLLCFAGGILGWVARTRDLRAPDLCVLAAGMWALIALSTNRPRRSWLWCSPGS